MFNYGIFSIIFFIYDFLQFEFNTPRCSLFVCLFYTIWCSLGFLVLWFGFWFTMGNFSVIIASNISFSSFCSLAMGTLYLRSCLSVLEFPVSLFCLVFYPFSFLYWKFLLTTTKSNSILSCNQSTDDLIKGILHFC